MKKAEHILEKHINENDLNFIFHEKKQLWKELLNSVNEALESSCDLVAVCPKCKSNDLTIKFYDCNNCSYTFEV